MSNDKETEVDNLGIGYSGNAFVKSDDFDWYVGDTNVTKMAKDLEMLEKKLNEVLTRLEKLESKFK